MKLVLCEKPSVAKQVALAIGKHESKEGYIKAGPYFITWAFGHLLEIDEKIAPEQWDLETLPVFPERFLYKPRDSKAKKQLDIIKTLLNQVQEVIINTDAGREGELIARLILKYLGYRGKVLRLWTSLALTPEVVRKELQNLKSAQEFDSLYWSALARQHGDWIVGINLTRAVSLKAKGKEVWSVGRVQTPTLALVVERDKQIENFKPEPYMIIKAIFDKGGQEYEGILLAKGLGWRGRTDDDDQEEEQEHAQEHLYAFKPETAQKVLEELQRLDKGFVEKVIKEVKKEYPPNLFSLTSLQRHMNKTYGWKAQKTLDIAQELYEKGYISYPRTDAEHMGEENKELVKEVLKALGREDLLPAVDKVGKRVFDNSKLTDHHAIVPLKDGEVEGDGGVLLKEIKKRFFAVFYPPFEYESTRVYTRIGKYLFESRGKRVLVQGWKELYEKVKDKELPELKERDQVKVKRIIPERKFTQPPKRYTEAELLKVMEKLNLGTPATRAGIIETLKERHYLREERKSLISTSKGRELIRKLEGSKVVSPELTSQWERFLDDIYKKRIGKEGYEKFIEGIKKFTTEEVESVKEKDFSYERESVGACPLCGGKVVEKPKSYSCENCSFVLWKTFLGKTITFSQAKNLLKGKSVLIKRLKSKTGKEFDAYIRLQEGKIVFDNKERLDSQEKYGKISFYESSGSKKQRSSKTTYRETFKKKKTYSGTSRKRGRSAKIEGKKD